MLSIGIHHYFYKNFIGAGQFFIQKSLIFQISEKKKISQIVEWNKISEDCKGEMCWKFDAIMPQDLYTRHYSI